MYILFMHIVTLLIYCCVENKVFLKIKYSWILNPAKVNNIWQQDILLRQKGIRIVWVYSETTWAVGIAQLTHHEVQGGVENPETEGRGIFAPTADRVVS